MIARSRVSIPCLFQGRKTSTQNRRIDKIDRTPDYKRHISNLYLLGNFGRFRGFVSLSVYSVYLSILIRSDVTKPNTQERLSLHD